MIKDSGERTKYESGAVRDMSSGKGRFDLAPWRGIWEVAKHCEEGAKKYGEHNVDKGIPIHSFIDSAFRHLMKYTLGMDDEPHLRAAAWNILWAMQTEIEHPELQDIPVWMEKKNHEQPEELSTHANSLKKPSIDKPKTIGDWIRSMNDRDLAVMLCSSDWTHWQLDKCEEWINSVYNEKCAQKD